MGRGPDAAAAFRKALAGVKLRDVRVEPDEGGPAGLVTIDLRTEDGDDQGTLDAFVQAYGDELLQVARQQEGADAALRLWARCGRHVWSGEQTPRTGVTTARAGPGGARATGRQRLQAESIPVMTRLRGDAVAALDLLVEAGVVRSRSLAVAWCVERTLQREAERIEALRLPVAAVRAVRQTLTAGAGVRTRFGKYSDAASQVVRGALAEAGDRNQALAQPVHLLLALLRQRQSLAVAALLGVGVDVGALESRAEAAAPRREAPPPRTVDVAGALRKVLGAFGAEAAEGLGRMVQGPDAAGVSAEMEPEHLLLGLLRVAGEGSGAGITFLAEVLGPEAAARLRVEILRLRKEGGNDRPGR